MFAFFADIHANREAFDACLADAEGRGAERLAFLGDLVGYGADPAYIVDRVGHLQSQGAIVVRGNHDAAVTGAIGSMNKIARAAIEWTRERLDARHRAFLAALPLRAELGNILAVHAEASTPCRWIYVTTAAEAQASLAATGKHLTVCGHVHRPQLYAATADTADILPRAQTPAAETPLKLAAGAKWLAVVGAVGQPRDGNPAAAYALYDDAARRLAYVRVRYNIAAAARKIRAAGLPDVLAARLSVGR